MKSLIKSINTNCCYEGSAMVKNKSEKELSFDLKAKHFSILDIKHIRKNYRRNQIVEREEAEGQKSISVIDQDRVDSKIMAQHHSRSKVSPLPRNSLLQVYCQKVSKLTEHQISLDLRQQQNGNQSMSKNDSFNFFKGNKNIAKRQKIQITCAKNHQNHLGLTRKRLSQGYLNLDARQTNKSHQISSLSLQSDKGKRFSRQMEPNWKRLNQTPQSQNGKYRFYSLMTDNEKFSMCTTVENSFANITKDHAITAESKVQKMNRNRDIIERRENKELILIPRTNSQQEQKQNDMNVGNTKMNRSEIVKEKAYMKYEPKAINQEQKVTESILFDERHQPSSHTENSTQILAIKQQINVLKHQYSDLKLQEQFLVNSLQQNHREFQARYKLLLEKKAQCQLQERLRRQEIGQIKKLLNQRLRNIS